MPAFDSAVIVLGAAASHAGSDQLQPAADKNPRPFALPEWRPGSPRGVPCSAGESSDICDYDVFTEPGWLQKGVFTIRISSDFRDLLDAIADAIDRPRSWVVTGAGEFATDAEVEAAFEKWQRKKAIAPTLTLPRTRGREE